MKKNPTSEEVYRQRLAEMDEQQRKAEQEALIERLRERATTAEEKNRELTRIVDELRKDGDKCQ